MKRASQQEQFIDEKYSQMAPRTSSESNSPPFPSHSKNNLGPSRTAPNGLPNAGGNAIRSAGPLPLACNVDEELLDLHFLEKFGNELKCPICKCLLKDPMLTKV